jgi:putative nucleotidyltransferase with HDIG domain
MNADVYAHLKSWFFTYVDVFRDESGGLCDILQLKFDHCARVSREALELAQDMNWSEGEVRLAEVIGLYHDIGRFRQFSEFQTMYDPASVNHAHCGAELLRREDVLSGCSQTHQRLIHAAVFFHNAKQIPDELVGDSRRFVQLVRDSDKLDNFFLFLGVLARGEIERYPQIIWNLPVQGEPSDDILDALMAGELCPYENARCLVDFLLIQLSWIYDLSFAASLRKVRAKNCVDLLEKSLPAGERTKTAVNRVRTYLNVQAW